MVQFLLLSGAGSGVGYLRCGLSSLQEVEKYSRSGKGLGGKGFTKARDVSEY